MGWIGLDWIGLGWAHFYDDDYVLMCYECMILHPTSLSPCYALSLAIVDTDMVCAEL